MRIVIVGAGDVGQHLCSLLSETDHNVTLIESDHEKAQTLDEAYDLRIVRGNGSSAATLYHADVSESDVFLAMTSDDRTNLVACSLAKALGARNTVARIHEQTYSDNSYVNYQSHFGIDHLINPEALCANELASCIRNPGRVAVEHFARGQIEVQRVDVHERSKLAGKSLAQIKLGGQVRIGFLQREGETMVPTGDTVIAVGDRVTVFGDPEAIHGVKRRFDPDIDNRTVRVVIGGGTEIALALVRLLKNPRFKIRIIEKEERVCRRLAEQFPHVTIVNGDSTSLRIMEEEQVGSADYYISATKRDEDNIMTGLQAQKLGAKHILLVINRADYEDIIHKLKWLVGVELTVSPREATGVEVLRYISTEKILELADMPESTAKVFEVEISESSPALGTPLRDLKLPSSSVIVALLRGGNATVPGADDALAPNDRIVIITNEENRETLSELLT